MIFDLYPYSGIPPASQFGEKLPYITSKVRKTPCRLSRDGNRAGLKRDAPLPVLPKPHPTPHLASPRLALDG